MAEELISGYVDRAAFKADTEFMINGLHEVLKVFASLKAMKYEVKGASTLQEFSNAAKQTQTEMDNLRKQNLELSKAIDAFVISQKAAKDATEASSKLHQASAKLIKDEIDSTVKLAASKSEISSKIAQNKAAQAELNKEQRLAAQLQETERNSLARAQALINQYTNEKKKLNLATVEGQRLNESYNKAIQRANEFILKNADAETKRTKNIGNYSQAVKILQDQLSVVIGKMDAYNKSGQANEQVMSQLTKEYDLLTKLVNSQEAGFANATMEIRANQKALMDLEAAGLSGTESFKKLEKATGELQDQLGDLKARTKQLGSDTFVFDGMISAAEGLAGAYGVAQGAAQLFGDDNEDLQKSMVKLQAVMTIIQGLQALQNALQAESAAMLLLQDVRTKALTISQGVYSIAVGTSTGAMKAFRIALMATGIGVVVGLLYMAAQAMGAFGDETDLTTEAINAQNEAIEKRKKSLKEVADQAEEARNQAKGGLNDLKRELELAQARGDSEEKLLKIKEEIYAKERMNLKTQFNTFEGYEDKQIEIREKGKDLANKIEAERLAYAKKKMEDEDKARKEAAEKQKRIREKALEDAKKFAEDEAKATFNIIKDNAEESARLAEKTADDEKKPLKERLSALMDFYNEKQNILNASKDFELIGVKEGSQQQLDIINKFGIESNKLFEVYAEKKLRIYEKDKENFLSTQKSRSEAFLSLLGEEKDKEKALLEQQYATAQKALIDRLNKKTITEQEYQDKSLRLTFELQQKGLEAEIKYAKQLLLVKQALGMDVSKEAAKIAQLELDLSKLTLDQRIKDEQKKRDEIKKTFDTIRDYTTNVMGVIEGALEAITTKQKNDIRDQLDAVEKKTAREIELVNASTATEEEKAARIAIINSRATAEKEALARKERQIEIEKARFKKAQTLFNIALDIAEALATLNFFKAAIATAQFAIAAATPIPRYFRGKGKADMYEGPAFVNDNPDGFTREVIERADGSLEFPSGRNVITNIGRGDVVHPDADAFIRSAFAVAHGGAIVKKSQSGGSEGEVLGEIKKHSKYLQAIANKPTQQIHGSEKGLVNLLHWGSNQVSYVQDNLQY